MPAKGFEDLIVAAESDAALAAALRDARTLAELVALGAEHGHVFGLAEAQAYLRALPARELDESELEALVGGTAAGKGSAKGEPYLKYEFKDILISSF